MRRENTEGMSIEESAVSQAASRTSAHNDSPAENTSGSSHLSLLQNNETLPKDGEVIQAASFTPLQGKVKKQNVIGAKE